MRIAICTPVYGDTKRRFTESLAALLIYTTRQRPDLEVTFQTVAMANLALARRALVEGALAWRADSVLWLDGDHTFPRDSLLRLLGHDLPVVGCNYPNRHDPVSDPGPTAVLVGDDGAKQLVRTTAASAANSPLREVHGMGLGVCLMRTSVIRAVPAPWFDMMPDGEDYYFFRKVRENGVKVVIDQQLSLQIGHMAEAEMRFTE